MRTRVVVAALGLLGTAPVAVLGQDVEMHRRPGGPPLPAAYYERIRENPRFFEFPEQGWAARTPLGAVASSALEGTIRILVVPVLFADSPEPHVEASEVRRVYFDGPAQVGTLTDYYHEISRGRLTVTGVVTPWVRTTLTRAEVLGNNFGMGATARTGEFLHQAMQAVDALVDLGQFDNDGPDGIPNSGDDDGIVDVVAFQFIEVAASCGGPGIWPHRGGLTGWGWPFESVRSTRPDGQPGRANGYIVQSTVDCDGGPPNIGVIAHEFGHVIGMPDFYHAVDGLLPSQRRWVLGCWSLMAAGAWGCGDGAAWPTANRPTHMGPFEKVFFGWVEQVFATNVHEREYVLSPVQTGGQVLNVPISSVEYLLVEYRPAIGFDAELPASGVLIYHVERTRPLYPPPGGPPIYMLSLVEADGDSALLRTALQGGNRGVAGDAWGIDRFALSSLTTPTLLRKNGSRSTVTFHSITVAGGVARIRVTSSPTPRLMTTAASVRALDAAAAELRAAGGAPPYAWAVNGPLPAGLRATGNVTTLSLDGTPTETGTFNLSVRITDALGVAALQPLVITVSGPAIAMERLVMPFVGGGAEPLTAAERQVLDQMGNGNGTYDIGDFRKYVLGGGGV